MSKKVKQEVIKKIEDVTTLNNYISADYIKKIVVCNIYDTFWGAVELADPVVKRFMDTGINANKYDFISAEKALIDPIHLGKMTIKSKPRYFIFYVKYIK